MMESFTIYPKFILVLFQVKSVSFLQITRGAGGGGGEECYRALNPFSVTSSELIQCFTVNNFPEVEYITWTTQTSSTPS